MVMTGSAAVGINLARLLVRSVTSVLNALDGVVNAEVSLDKQCAVVNYDAAKLGLEQLKRTIEEAGYEVAG